MKLVRIEVIKDELERLIRDFRFHSSTEAKYRCEAYRELSEWLDNLDVVELSDDLEEAAKFYAATHTEFLDSECKPHVAPAFIAGAKWQEEQMEKNRIEHCHSITEEQYNLETSFVDSHIKKYHRIPTILDAIEYGMSLKKGE